MRTFPLSFVALAIAASVHAQSPMPEMRDADRIRLAEARRLLAAASDSVWLGWSGAPSALLLVTPEREFLLWHPRPSSDFQRAGYDSLLASDVYTRPRQFAPNLLATFPAVGGVPTIVIGTPEQTRKRSTAWVLTVAHEHFHQWQTSQPDYYARVAALDLARGDSTGMWMLNYGFPYSSPDIRTRFDAVAGLLRVALKDTARTDREQQAREIDRARRELRAALPPADYRYLDFQLWQEGVARYTEYAVARYAALHYQPTGAFRALADADPFVTAADRLRREIVETESVSLTNERVAFYPVGAALGLWLDRSDPAWRRRYLERMLTLDPPTSQPR